ncbi:hypothetical protein D3C85_1402240 [compost metagenome]
MKPVHVLLGRDGLDDLVRVHVLGQRKLHQDAVDGRVLVQDGDAGQQFGLGHLGRVLLFHGMQAGLFAGRDLVAHIHLRRGVRAHQHHGQAGAGALGGQGRNALGDFFADAQRQCRAVNNPGCHA